MLLELISRAQFGFTITFHILFPAFSIGLITFIAIMEGAWIKTANRHYLTICKFWTKILALTFGMGIVSGVVMEFQLGTNWANFSREVGSVLGALFTYEVLTAFFIEAGFLGVMFFGWNRVPPKLHYAATLLALLGVTLSTFWIMSANSWMQTPSGAVYENHRFIASNWLDVIFNPSFLPRFFHMLLASYIAAFLVIAGICAFYLLRKQHVDFAKTCFSFVMWALLVLVPLQIFVGDEVGLVIHEHQPLKTAAMEGVWDTQKGAPLVLFAWPNTKTEKNDFAITIPKLAAWINTHDLEGELVGLKSVSAADRPPVAVVFWSFRIMVGLGIGMLLIAIIAVIQRVRKKLYDSQWFLTACLWFAPSGFISIIMGWFTAEFGRQPWVVYGYLRTMNAHSNVVLHQVLTSFIAIVLVYGVIFGYFYFRFFLSTIVKGPTAAVEPTDSLFSYMAPDLRQTQEKSNHKR